MRHRKLRFAVGMTVVILAIEAQGAALIDGNDRAAAMLYGVVRSEENGTTTDDAQLGDFSGAGGSVSSSAGLVHTEERSVILEPALFAVISPSGLVVASIIDGKGGVRLQRLLGTNGLVGSITGSPDASSGSAGSPAPQQPVANAIQTMIRSPATANNVGVGDQIMRNYTRVALAIISIATTTANAVRDTLSVLAEHIPTPIPYATATFYPTQVPLPTNTPWLSVITSTQIQPTITPTPTFLPGTPTPDATATHLAEPTLTPLATLTPRPTNTALPTYTPQPAPFVTELPFGS